MSDEAKCYAATPAATLEQHITDSNVAKNDAEWWAHHEITRLREELNCWHEASNWPEKSPLALREENARLAEQLRLANVDCFNMEAENARLREALAPFVDAGHAKIVVTTGATEEDNMINICVKERDLRRAKEISK